MVSRYALWKSGKDIARHPEDDQHRRPCRGHAKQAESHTHSKKSTGSSALKAKGKVKRHAQGQLKLTHDMPVSLSIVIFIIKYSG